MVARHSDGGGEGRRPDADEKMLVATSRWRESSCVKTKLINIHRLWKSTSCGTIPFKQNKMGSFPASTTLSSRDCRPLRVVRHERVMGLHLLQCLYLMTKEQYPGIQKCVSAVGDGRVSWGKAREMPLARSATTPHQSQQTTPYKALNHHQLLRFHKTILPLSPGIKKRQKNK